MVVSRASTLFLAMYRTAANFLASDNQSGITILLSAESKEMDNVVVTALGITRKTESPWLFCSKVAKPI